MGMDLVPTIAKFVIILTLQGEQFIGVREYDTESECYQAAFQRTQNTLIEANCIPNYKTVPTRD